MGIPSQHHYRHSRNIIRRNVWSDYRWSVTQHHRSLHRWRHPQHRDTLHRKQNTPKSYRQHRFWNRLRMATFTNLRKDIRPPRQTRRQNYYQPKLANHPSQHHNPLASRPLLLPTRPQRLYMPPESHINLDLTCYLRFKKTTSPTPQKTFRGSGGKKHYLEFFQTYRAH